MGVTQEGMDPPSLSDAAVEDHTGPFGMGLEQIPQGQKPTAVFQELPPVFFLSRQNGQHIDGIEMVGVFFQGPQRIFPGLLQLSQFEKGQGGVVVGREIDDIVLA